MKSFRNVWLISLIVKVVVAIWLPLSNDEAYYWVWGQLPQWSYFDHPPAVAWLFWLGSFFDFGGGASRLPAIFLGHITLLIWHEILKPYMNEGRLKFWLLFVLFSPFLGIGSLIITPDVPLVFFWSLSLLLFLKLLKTPKATTYLALGASLGLGFCSKYLIVLFVPCAFIWLFWSGDWRKVRWSLVPLTIITGLLFCFPVLYWNAQNEWVSFKFQLNHGLGEQARNWRWPVDYVTGQLGLLFPLVILLALRRNEPRESRFLHVFGWFPIAFFFYASFKARGEANWPIMAHPAIFSLAVLNAQPGKLMQQRWLPATLGFWIVATLVVLSQVAYPWIPLDPKKLKTSEFERYDVIAAEAAKHENFFLGSYQMAGAVSYKLRRVHYKMAGLNRRDFFDFLPQSTPKSDRFYLGADDWQPPPAWLADAGYEVTSTQRLTGNFVVYEVTRRAQGTHQ